MLRQSATTCKENRVYCSIVTKFFSEVDQVVIMIHEIVFHITFLYISEATMGKPAGIQTARKHVRNRRSQVWADKDYKKAHLGTRWKANPFGGASHAKVCEKTLWNHCFKVLGCRELFLRKLVLKPSSLTLPLGSAWGFSSSRTARRSLLLSPMTVVSTLSRKTMRLVVAVD